MSRIKILFLASSIALVSFLAGAYTIYIWLSNDSEKAIATNILMIRIPVERKEIYMLSLIAQGLDTTTPSETRNHICRLVNFKVGQMKESVKQFAMPYASHNEEILKLTWSKDIAVVEQMAASAKCSLASGSHISIERDALPRSGSRPTP
jgi:hypothetical protein